MTQKHLQYNGWAFTEDEKGGAQQNMDRYKELCERKVQIEIKKTTPKYGHTVYEGVISEDVDPLDVMIYCDRGNVCFGGNCTIETSGIFKCLIWTD